MKFPQRGRKIDWKFTVICTDFTHVFLHFLRTGVQCPPFFRTNGSRAGPACTGRGVTASPSADGKNRRILVKLPVAGTRKIFYTLV